MSHHSDCNAAICRDDTNPNFKNEVVWYPGEKVCEKVPLTKFQVKQRDINSWVEKGKFRKSGPYTAHQLETALI